jgi:aminoglycoside phosphotransferase family enzyme/predicted kinase
VAAALPEQLRNLLTAAAYPHPVDAIELVETHVSWVLLTGRYAYKIKRPVHYPFIDLRSLAQRAFFCREELRLNSRFAAELYLGVCPVTLDNDLARIDGPGIVIDHAVRMTQFRREDELDRLLESRNIDPWELGDFGRDLARIHGRLPVASGDARHGTPDTLRSLILENLEQCMQACTALAGQLKEMPASAERLRSRLSALRAVLAQRLGWLESALERRLAGGRVRECHGDLHTRNVVRCNGRLLAFDCLEFDPAFRWIDVADDVAFLLMDLEVLSRPGHAYAFLSGYLEECGDYEACRVLDLYKAHRALVRAKVVALAAAGSPTAGVGQDAEVYAQCQQYVGCAEAALATRRPQLLLMSGVSGSGKTWLAQRLAPGLRALHIRSDVERRRLVEPSSDTRSTQVGEGRYTPGAKARVYEHLVQCAEHALSGGYSAIIDATFVRLEDRRRFYQLASRLGVAARVIHCHAAPQTLRARVSKRLEQRSDASEADLAVLEWQQAHAEPPLESEGVTVTEVDTTGSEPAPSRGELLESLRALP